MVQIPDEVKLFVERVKHQFNPDAVLLFGSQATGKARVDSDYDILIVSEMFKGVKPHKRSTQAYRLHDGLFALEVVCLTPAEYADLKERPTIVREAARSGIALYGAA